MGLRYFSFILIGLILALSFGIVFAANNATINMEANILANPENNEPEISIDVSPNSINFGDIELGQESNAIRVNITNMGSVAINVVPQLSNGNNNIFENLYFQKRKTGNSSTEYQIGDFTLNIAQPTSDSGKAEYCYVKLNLENVDSGDLDESDFGNEDADVIFIALAA